jgi:hypothetical protein
MHFLRQVAKHLFFVILLIGSTTTFAQKKKDKQDWEKIFNGKDLTGWDIKIAGEELNSNYKNTFRVEEGILKIEYDQYQKFDDKYGHIYYNKPYSYYKIRFEYRFVGNQTPGGASWNVRNSGVMLHSQSAESLSFGQDFPVSLELQLLGGLGSGTRHTGNLCTPGTQVHINGELDDHHCIESSSNTYHGDVWVRAEAIVLGDSIIHHFIEGEKVLTYTHPIIGGGFVGKNHNWVAAKIDNADFWIHRENTPLGEGYIALQAESHPIHFRNIEVLNLKGCMDPKASNYKSYYQKADNSLCKYGKK